MGELKTKKNSMSVSDFIRKVENEKKRDDAFKLLEIFTESSGFNPVMWGDSIIGFGEYHYKSERSSQEGDWPLTGFSPRKTKFSLYIMSNLDNYVDLFAKLGKFKKSVGCVYVNKLDDVDVSVLKQLIKRSVADMKKLHNVR